MQPALTSHDLTRVDDTTIQLRLGQRARYDIEMPETVTLVVPSSATYAGHALAAPEELAVQPQRGSVRFQGNLLRYNNDAAVQDGRTLVLVLVLTGDTWVPAVENRGGYILDSILNGLRSQQSEAYGWNAEVVPVLLDEAKMVASLKKATDEGNRGTLNKIMADMQTKGIVNKYPAEVAAAREKIAALSVSDTVAEHIEFAIKQRDPEALEQALVRHRVLKTAVGQPPP